MSVPTHHTPAPPPRKQRVTAVQETLKPLLKAAFGRKGFTDAALVYRWAELIPPPLNQFTRPLKIVFNQAEQRMDGTLHIGVASPFALEAQHAVTQLLDRVNAAFGYTAVARIKLQQEPLSIYAAKMPAKKPPTPPLPAAPIRVADEGLATALANLSRWIK